MTVPSGMNSKHNSLLSPDIKGAAWWAVIAQLYCMLGILNVWGPNEKDIHIMTEYYVVPSLPVSPKAGTG